MRREYDSVYCHSADVWRPDELILRPECKLDLLAVSPSVGAAPGQTRRSSRTSDWRADTTRDARISASPGLAARQMPPVAASARCPSTGSLACFVSESFRVVVGSQHSHASAQPGPTFNTYPHGGTGSKAPWSPRNVKLC